MDLAQLVRGFSNLPDPIHITSESVPHICNLMDPDPDLDPIVIQNFSDHLDYDPLIKDWIYISL